MENIVARWIAHLPTSGSHAYLITGKGRADAARSASAALLCERGGESACGVCQSCRLTVGDNHPDFLQVRCQDGEKQIKIDVIRALIADCHVAPRFFRKVIWIDEAHTMNAHAQNALLRTLEEPPANVHFFLTGAESGLLPTIRSRCALLRLGGGEAETFPDETIALAEETLALMASGNALECIPRFPAKKDALTALFAALTALLRDQAAIALGRPAIAHTQPPKTRRYAVGPLTATLELALEARSRLERNFSPALTVDWFLLSAARVWQRAQRMTLANRPSR